MEYLKLIAFLVVFSILSQGCLVVYKTKPLSLEEASGYENKKMKMFTKDGNKYKFRKIKEIDENVVIINNMKEVSIPFSEIKQINTINPEQIHLSLDSACNYDGIVEVIGKNVQGDLYNIKLTNIEKEDGKMIGDKITKKDTANVVLPVNQVEEIKVKDKGLSAVANITFGIGIVIATFYALFIMVY